MGHMNKSPEPEARAHDADGKTEVSGGSDRDGVPGKEIVEFLSGKALLGHAGLEEAFRKGDLLCGL